eukprot:8786863-Prorocentrum_lima.AAC.1
MTSSLVGSEMCIRDRLIKAWSAALGLKKHSEAHLANSEVLCLAKRLPVHQILSFRRLALVRRMVKGPRALLALITEAQNVPGTWSYQLRLDAEWAASFLYPLEGDPRFLLQWWLRLALLDPE